MVSHDELLAQARRRYPDLLRAIVGGTAFFPLELRIGKTRRAENYAERAAELSEFRTAANALGITVEWRSVNDPRFGSHERPDQACFANEAAFLAALGKAEEARAFREDLALIRAGCPALETWLVENTRQIVDYHGVWPELLRVVRWFQVNPRSGLYLRQLPIEGVDTKFIESHQAVLDALLLHVQPSAVRIEGKRFESRHGLRWEEPLVRLRFLDSELQSTLGFPVADLSVPAPTFRALSISGVAVIITENLRNFLALPQLPGVIAVFGGGGAVTLLAGAGWLQCSRIFYWGDIDSHGFEILDRLRAVYPSTTSILMGSDTLEAHLRWTVKTNPGAGAPFNLTSAERAAFVRVSAESLRLEQERLPYDAVVDALRSMVI